MGKQKHSLLITSIQHCLEILTITEWQEKQKQKQIREKYVQEEDISTPSLPSSNKPFVHL